MKPFKITLIGAGSTIFAKNLMGDCMLRFSSVPFEIALFDIDFKRLDESKFMLDCIAQKYGSKAKIIPYHARLEALDGADFVVNAIQVGGYDSTLIDFEIPKKYGLKQTIADTLGIGGIFRALRTFPVLDGIAEDMKKVCPKALFLNYVNPMCMITKYLIEHLNINTVGLCHSVQYCVPTLLRTVDLHEFVDDCKWEIAGINHQAWLLRITDGIGNDLYPEIKRRSLLPEYAQKKKWDGVRHEIMHRFGYYVTESSEHSSEYTPYFIKDKYPELIERYSIPIDEYLRRCVKQEKEWNERRKTLLTEEIEHEISNEFASLIVGAYLGAEECVIHGNVMNDGLISNLPSNACVEVPCVVSKGEIKPQKVGYIPEQCAAINRTNVNVQNMVYEAGVKKDKNLVYMAAYLDPHTSAELSLDDIKSMCDDLFQAHKDLLNF